MITVLVVVTGRMIPASASFASFMDTEAAETALRYAYKLITRQRCCQIVELETQLLL